MDERLRKLEREAATGGWESEKRLFLEKMRKEGMSDDPWNMFDQLFDAVLAKPWDQKAVKQLRAFAEWMPVTPEKGLEVFGNNKDFALAYNSRYTDRIPGTQQQKPGYSGKHFFPSSRRAIIKGGWYRAGNSEWDSQNFSGSSRVLILDGNFFGAFKRARNCIVMGGDFSGESFQGASNILVLGGNISSTFKGANNILVLGGKIKSAYCFERARDIAILDHGKTDLRKAAYTHSTRAYFGLNGAENVRIWVPQELPALVTHFYGTCIIKGTNRIHHPWQNSRLSVYMATCPPREGITAKDKGTYPDIRSVPFENIKYGILPQLRKSSITLDPKRPGWLSPVISFFDTCVNQLPAKKCNFEEPLHAGAGGVEEPLGKVYNRLFG